MNTYKKNKADNETGSDNKRERKNEEEDIEESEFINRNATETFEPYEEYSTHPQNKHNQKKKNEKKRKNKGIVKQTNSNQGPKEKRTRELTKKQPKKVQEQETQQLVQPPPNKNQMTIEQLSNQQQKQSPIIELHNQSKPLNNNTPFNLQSKEKNQLKLTPKLKLFTHHEKKERIYLVNLKCSKGFERLLENSLSALFYDSKQPGCPSLKLIEHKLMRKEYKTIYDFGYDMRNIWNFYFKYYSSSPQYYQLTYNMSEYSENVISELEEMSYFPKNQEPKKIECLSMEEKEELGENINLLSQADLKKLIQLFNNNMMKINGTKKLFEFDINSLPNETQMKMYRFVKRCIHNQTTGEKGDDKEDKIEMERIRKLKVI